MIDLFTRFQQILKFTFDKFANFEMSRFLVLHSWQFGHFSTHNFLKVKDIAAIFHVRIGTYLTHAGTIESTCNINYTQSYLKKTRRSHFFLDRPYWKQWDVFNFGCWSLWRLAYIFQRAKFALARGPGAGIMELGLAKINPHVPDWPVNFCHYSMFLEISRSS